MWGIKIDGVDDRLIVPENLLTHIRFGKKPEESRIVLRVFCSSKSANHLELFDGSYIITAGDETIEGWVHPYGIRGEMSVGKVIKMLESFDLNFCDTKNPVPRLSFELADGPGARKPVPIYSLGGFSAVSFKVKNPDADEPWFTLVGFNGFPDDQGWRMPIYSGSELAQI